jgi:molecular chaperone Hsp33
VTQPDLHPDDHVATFQLEGEQVRGRIVRLGPVIHEILSRHDYPEAVANLLGEACVLAALVGSSLKFDGRLIVQAQGDGPVRYVVADYDTSGGLRGYCQFDKTRVQEVSSGFVRPGAATLLGQGLMMMTIDPVNLKDRYQGVVPIEGETLALCAETYFAQSEQAPARIRLSTAQVTTADRTEWRAGGALIQNIAGDAARGDTVEAWCHAEALFVTIAEDELVDPTIPTATLLYRLFHEDGVRLYPPLPIAAMCRCSQERVLGMLKSFPAEEIMGMVEPDGLIHVNCEYCSRNYRIMPETIESAEGE